MLGFDINKSLAKQEFIESKKIDVLSNLNEEDEHLKQ
jgi:hypothetical protein